MKLEGSELLYVKARMTQAKERGREEMPIRVSLSLSPETDFDYVKSNLGNYQAKVVEIPPLGEKLELKGIGKVITMVEVPAKNLRKVIEQAYVECYEWPAYVELLSADKTGHPSRGPSPQHFEVSEEFMAEKKLRRRRRQMERMQPTEGQINFDQTSLGKELYEEN